MTLRKGKEPKKNFKDHWSSSNQLSKHNEEVRENERLSISRELHDDLGQALTAVKIDLENYQTTHI